MATPLQNLELRSLITQAGELELSLVESEIAAPVGDQVVVRVEAAPINPSDLALLFGPADPGTMRGSGTSDRPLVTATVPASRLPSVEARLGQSMPVGNEGAGVVVAAGEAASELVGKMVCLAGGGMFARYRVARARECMVLPAGTTAVQGASAFVNPMTALSMIETMRHDGHTAIVHTAAASNLGQMLVRVCASDGIPLVNIVRSAEQVTLLRKLGAVHVVDSTSPNFRAELVEAVATTGATLAFDAISGGPLASQILSAMEVVASRKATSYSRYGSSVHKQVYIYGRLDLRPTELDASAGFAWSVGGWLLTTFLGKAGGEVIQRLRTRVLAELTTTFASHYTGTLGLAEALQPAAMAAYGKRATGAKYLLDPTR
ncbi:MAG: zinc-binding dehydrogenase [Myxococcales bacterium]|nr:zinc-binding dehydrogenase [Myxococcales bacterium]